MLTMIKKETKKGMMMILRSENYEGRNLHDVYKNFSYEKEKSFYNCLQKYHDENGENFHICSHNCNFYSVTWKTEKGIRLETAYNSYLIY